MNTPTKEECSFTFNHVSGNECEYSVPVDVKIYNCIYLCVLRLVLTNHVVSVSILL